MFSMASSIRPFGTGEGAAMNASMRAFMRAFDSRVSKVAVQWRDPADGVLCSANVPRLAYGLRSSFISLRRAHHRRDRSERCLIDEHNTASPVSRAWGVSRSEVKEEAKPGDMSGGKYPVALARTTTPTLDRQSIDEHTAASPVPRVWSVSRSEVKEEAKPGDMSGGKYSVASVRASEEVMRSLFATICNEVVQGLMTETSPKTRSA